MKSLNFWRALFVSALALTTFAACSDDDAEGGFKERPEISVNGKTSATVARDLEAGLTEAVEVVSAGPWSVEFDNAADAAWCTPMIDGKATLTSKGGGTSMLTFDLSGTDAARETSFTLIATGELMGYPLTAKATVTVKQNAGGSTAIETNVKAVRDRLTFESTAKTIEESIVLTGIVVSDFVGNNINNHQIMVTDNTTEPGAGLMVRFKGYIGNSKPTDMNLPAGSIVQLELKGGAAQSYNGTYQVNFTDASADPEVKVLSQEGNMPEAITVENPNDLAAYQSQYVQVYSQPVEAVRGKAYYSDAASSGYANKLFQTKNGATFQLSFGSYTSTWAANVTIPSNAGYIKGCVSLNQSVGNISPRNADDLAGMTEELFEVEAAQGTISQITATGEYKVADAMVVAVSTRSFIMADATGAFLVFRGSAEGVPAVGTKVSVEGTVENYGGMLQFGKEAVVTTGDKGEVAAREATEITASNIQTVIDDKKVVYVKMSGELVKSGNYYNLNFNFDANGKSGAIDAPVADLGLDNYVGQVVDIEGWFIYTTGSGARFTVIATKVTGDTTTPRVSFSSTPAQFAAENPSEQTIAYTKANITGSVEFSIEGTNLDKFSVVSSTDAEVVVKAAGNNTSGSAYTAKLVAKYNGSTLAETDLKQAAKTTGGQGSVTIKFADCGWANAEKVTSYEKDGITLEFAKNSGSSDPAYYATGTALRLYAANSLSVSGANITKIEFEFVDGYSNFVSAEPGSYAAPTWTGTADKVVFTSNPEKVDGKYPQTRIVSMTVTYGNGTTGGDDNPGGQTVVTADFTADEMPEGIPTSSYEKETKTFQFGGYDFTFVSDGTNGYKFDTKNKYLIFGKTGAYIQLPVIEGKKLTKVVCVSRSGASGNVEVGIADTDGNYVAGGEAIKWTQADPYTFTYDLTNTAAGTAYCVRINNKYNAQITTMELTYE